MMQRTSKANFTIRTWTTVRMNAITISSGAQKPVDQAHVKERGRKAGIAEALIKTAAGLTNVIGYKDASSQAAR